MRYKSYIASTTSKDDPRFKDLYLFHGKSAYQAAVEMGYKGTEEEWIRKEEIDLAEERTLYIIDTIE